MARLEYTITGTNTGLADAASGAIGILNNLQAQADKLKIGLFSATTKKDIDSIGGALTAVTGKIREYTDSAIKGSQAFKDQSAIAALDALAIKINVLAGNAQLFGNTLQNQQAQVRAYQGAIDKLLSAGFTPMDSRVVSLKGNVDALNTSITALKNNSAPPPPIVPPLGLIEQAEKKIKDLGIAIRQATDVNSINAFNQQLSHATQELQDLNRIGLTASQVQNRLATSTRGAGLGFNQVGIEVGRVLQDLPYAANNFGAVGNNITRIVEVLPGYLAQTRAMIVANGGVATSAAVAKTALAGLFTGVGAISLAISAAVAGFVIYQQVQQANARKAAEHTDAIQKQKKALDDYLLTLNEVSQSTAKGAANYDTEVTKLDILYNSLTKNVDARYNNVKALEELQKSWPQEFGNLQKGAGFVNQLSAAYTSLRFNLIQTGIAAAAQSLSAEATKKMVENTVALAGADKAVADAQAEYNKKLDEYNKLRFSPNRGGAAGGGAGTSELNDASSAAANAKSALTAAKDSAATFRIEAFKARQEIEKFNKASIDAQNKLTQPVNSGLVYNLEQEIKLLQDQQPFIKSKVDLEANVLTIKQKQAELDALLGKNIKAQNAERARALSLSQQLQAIFDKGIKSASESGLQGYALEIQKINNFYKDLNAELDSFNKKVEIQKKNFTSTFGKSGLSPDKASNLLGQADRGRATLAGQQFKELLDASIKETTRVNAEVQRINDEFGVKAEVSRQKELAQITAKYDAEVNKAKGNAVILKALDEGRLSANQAINDKYAALQDDLYSKIATINDTAQAAIAGQEEDQTQKIRNEWNARKKAAEEYYQKIKELSKTGNAFYDALNAQILSNKAAATGTATDNAASAEINRAALKPLTDGLGRAVRNFGQDFIDTLTSVETYAKGSFESIFSELTSKLSSSLNKVFFDVVLNGLSKALTSAITNGTSSLFKDGKLSGLGAGIAGAGLAGGILSAATPKTSTVGQGAGGALSGAAAGAAIGSVVPIIGTVAGAVVGGLVGLVGGVFGSSAARKQQEETQKQQLEEAKKQTELLRQAQAAYTSAIIGRFTQQGVVTGINVGATGQLTARISGRDLQFILDSNKNVR